MTRTLEPHSHGFPETDWPFPDPMNMAAFASVQVIRQDAPVLLVYHDHDGDWQFLHGDVTEEDEGLVICLGCAYQRTPAIAELASMPSGWRAERADSHSPWERAPYEDSDGIA
jgi:hypothetical protein